MGREGKLQYEEYEMLEKGDTLGKRQHFEQNTKKKDKLHINKILTTYEYLTKKSLPTKELNITYGMKKITKSINPITKILILMI